MNWNGISEFVAVAEQQSFTKAAEIIGISTAQISRLINQLEKRLSLKLFYRTTRKVSLTEEGDLFYHKCRQLLDGLEEAEALLQDYQAEAKGSIKVTAPTTYGERCILPLVTDFLRLHPKVKIEVYLTNRKVNLLEEGIDLAIRIGALEDSSMMAAKLTRRKNHLCASADYFKQNNPPKNIEDLKTHNCLVGSSEQWKFKQNGKIKTLKVKGRLKYNSGYGLVDAAQKDLGIIYLPDFYVTDLIESNQLVSVLEDKTIDEDIWALYPNNRFLSLKVKLLLQHLKKELA